MKILIALLLSVPCFALEPVRPTYRDISVKVFEAKMGDAYKWYRGKTASQIERDAMEETANGLAMPELVRIIRDIPECKQAYTYAMGNWSKITSKLGGGYEDNSLLSKVWSLDTQGRHYSFEQYIMLKSRDCLVSSKVAPKCAMNPLVTGDVQDLLDIRVEAGKCVKGATSFSVTPPMEEFNSKYGDMFPVQIQTKTPQKALNASQHDLLHKTHEAHAAISKWRCEGGVKPNVDVDAAHRALEESALDKDQQHFFMMKRFSGTVDPKLPIGQECMWAKLQDKFHGAWMEAVGHADRATAWKESRKQENNHQLSHLCMNVYDPNLLVQFSCEKKRILDCEVMTCSEFLKSQGY